ncbi:MAG: serine/threonine-protein phosphatase [Muribaculaceae bacterium]|nr:serine/threonine-protein phosphatase [Muribaculaceae bacterium]
MNNVIEYTNKGSREENQDYLSWSSLSDRSSIYVLADGMGGYNYGDVAAKIVAESIIEFSVQNLGKCTPVELLKESLSYANDCLMLKKMALSVKQMGCVIVVLLIQDEDAYLTWLGDSRIYMFRDGLEVFRTTDHSVVNELSKIKALSVEDIERYSAIVTKSIMGVESLDAAPIRKVKTEPNDVFILCSDGLHKEFSVSSVANCPQDALGELKRSALQANDNLSFIRIQVES